MKKILVVLGISLCTLTSCVETQYKEVDGRKVEVLENDNFTMTYVEFDGHEYVRYYNGYRGSICHSPKCHCLIDYKK